MKTLVLVSHMDDEVLSCGGLIQKRLKQGGKVQVRAVFGRTYNYGKGPQYSSEQVNAYRNACEMLGVSEFFMWNLEEGEPQQHGYYKILELIEGVLHDYDPEEVVLQSSSDLNQDHRWLAEIGKIALRPANLKRVHRIIAAHGIDGPLLPTINWFEVLSEEQLNLKLKAMECYERESRVSPHPRSPENLISRHKIVGSMCGEKLAEPYTVLLQKG